MKYDIEYMDHMAKNLTHYYHLIRDLAYIPSLTPKQYKHKLKKLKKWIKKLEEHDGDAIFDKKEYIKYMQRRDGGRE